MARANDSSNTIPLRSIIVSRVVRRIPATKSTSDILFPSPLFFSRFSLASSPADKLFSRYFSWNDNRSGVATPDTLQLPYARVTGAL